MENKHERPKSPYDRGGRRKPIYNTPMRMYALKISSDMHQWLKAQPGGMAKTIRALVIEAIKESKDNR